MNENKIPKPPTSDKKLIIIMSVLGVLGVLFLGHAFLYGWVNFHNCIYTEKVLPIPQAVEGSIIKMERSMYLVRGKSPDHCTKSFENIDNEIVSQESIDSIGGMVSAETYYKNLGLSVDTFPIGHNFTIKKIISETKHGISAIDSGPGPIVYLVLEDEQGAIYQMGAVYLGTTYDKTDMPRFDYYKNNQRIDTLYYNMFEHF